MSNQFLTFPTPSIAEVGQEPCQLFAVGGQKRSGLILCKAYHAEFAGPGAAVGCSVEQEYETVITIGSPELVAVTTLDERQRAYSSRIQWIRWLQKFAEHPDPAMRAEKLITSFEAFFGYQVAAGLPDEVLALLVGVLPQTIRVIRSQKRGLSKVASIEAASDCDRLKICIFDLKQSSQDTIESSPAEALTSKLRRSELLTAPNLMVSSNLSPAAAKIYALPYSA